MKAWAMISISHVSHKLVVQESHFFNKLTASSTLQKVDCCFDHFQCYLSCMTLPTQDTGVPNLTIPPTEHCTITQLR